MSGNGTSPVALAAASNAPPDLEWQTTARVIESLVLKGDISGLNPAERASYYRELCASLGLNAATQPIAFIPLNGKLVPYFLRNATDQLAALHRLHRKIIDGPKLIDVAGVKIISAACEATHPNGRVETATGMVPLPPANAGAAEAICNAYMKCETKSRRRVTLSILGLGIMLDESEVESTGAFVEDTTVESEDLDELREQLATDEGPRSIAHLVSLFGDLRRATDDEAVLDEGRKLCRVHAKRWKKLSAFQKGCAAIENEIAAAKRAKAQPGAPQLPAVDPVAHPTLASVVTATPAKAEAVAAAPFVDTAAQYNNAPFAAQTAKPAPAAVAPAVTPPASAKPAPDPLASFLVDLRAVVETPSQCVALARSYKSTIDAVSKADKKRAWTSLVSRCEDVGRTDAEAWLKAELAKPIETEPAFEEPRDEEADEERAAIEDEDGYDDAGDAPPRSDEDNGRLLAAIGRIRECVGGPQRVANSFGVHVTDLPDHLRADFRESTAIYLRGRFPGKVKSLDAANTMLDEAVVARDANGRDEQVK